MSDTSESGTPSVPEVRSRLQAAAQMLGESTVVEPAVRTALTQLLEELSRALEAPAAPPGEVARLADGAARLADALHHRHDQGLLEASRDRLGDLALQAETRAPTIVHLAQDVIDALANLGI